MKGIVQGSTVTGVGTAVAAEIVAGKTARTDAGDITGSLAPAANTIKAGTVIAAVTGTYNQLSPAIAGAILVVSANAWKVINSDTYVVAQRFTAVVAGSYRIGISLDNHSGQWAYAKVYRNGVAVGTEHSNTYMGVIGYTEDIAGWSAGDTIDIYVHGTIGQANGVYCYVSTTIGAQATILLA